MHTLQTIATSSIASFRRSESRTSTSNSTRSHRSKSKSSFSNRSNDPPSSPENTVFCIRASDSSSSTHHRHSRRRPNPLPRRSSTQTTPSDYVNKIANLFTKSFSNSSPPSSPARPVPTSVKHEQDIATQTYETISSSMTNLTSNDSSRPYPSNQITISTHKNSPRTVEQVR